MTTETESGNQGLCWRMTRIDWRAEDSSVREIERACAPFARCGGLPIRPESLQLLYTYGRRRSVKERRIQAR